MRGSLPIDLLAQAPDEDVHRPVAVRLAPAPELLQQLVTGDDATAVEGELVEQPELRRRQLGALVVDVRLHLERVDPQLLDLDRLPPRRLLAAKGPARRRANARHELLHRERLYEVVVRADLERVHAIVLGAAGRDDHDRGADSLSASGLDQLPAVHARQHQIEHADIRLLVAKPCQPLRAVADRDGVEPRGAEVPRHSLRDDLVVLDDENLGHACLHYRPGFRWGRVDEW